MTTPPTTDPLLPHHRAALAASAIADAVAQARGYRSVTTKAALKRLGFGEAQCLVPTLLVPLWGAHGEIALYHHRPDTPRVRDGRPAKYEFPGGARMALDVHPSLKDRVRDPSLPLLITEGVKKADAAVSAGLCCVAVVGVWNWRGTNELGGKTALPDWEHVALQGRRVYLAFDSDAGLKAAVYQALARLAAFLARRGADVAFLTLPHGADGRKTGLDDYLAAGHTPDQLLALATTTLREPPRPGETAPGDTEWETPPPPYRETAAGLVWHRPTPSGPVAVPLTNFTARIVADVVEDDGAEGRRLFEVEARRGARVARLTLSAATFAAMNWPTEHLGAAAIVYPGLGTRDHARAAIQVLSGEPPARQVFTHTGWRTLPGGGWAYLHAAGAVPAPEAEPAPLCEPSLRIGGGQGEGSSQTGAGIQVRLPAALDAFRLPDPPTGGALRAAIGASLRLLDLLPDPLSVPLLAAVYRAPLGPADFTAFLAGPSGAFKSEVAALCQQHYGPGLDARHLPAAWASTDNFLEGLAFAAQDALLVIDDFAPVGTTVDIQRLHAKADRVLRGQGNRAGRGRMQADGTLRPPRPPRGLILATGEDVPQGASLRGRLCILELGPGEVAPETLTACQHDAAAGHYAAALAGYLQWLTPQYDTVRDNLRAEIAHWRDQAAAAGLHRRTPEITANLAVGLRWLLAYAEAVGAVSRVEARALWERGWGALGDAAHAQGRHQAASEPTRRYLELLVAALAAGRAHVASLAGEAPTNADRWGWRRVRVGAGEWAHDEWCTQGERIGWVADEDLYLQPDAAYNVARRMGTDGGDGLTLGAKTLHKRLKEKNLLASTQEARGTLTVRVTVAGSRQSVLHLAAASLLPMPMEKSAHSAQPARWLTEAGEHGPQGEGRGQVFDLEGESGQSPWADSGAASAPPHTLAGREDPFLPMGVGPPGQIGQVPPPPDALPAEGHIEVYL